MARIYRFCLFLVPFLLLSPEGQAANVESNTVRTDITETKLISSVDGIAPGLENFYLSLRISLKNHWHTYWQNPGDSGMPVTIKLDLPKGFKAGDIDWPIPEIIDTAGIINYGYSNEVDLLIPLTITQDVVGKSSSYTIKAKANWLVCKDICIPESADLTIEIPASPSIDKIANNYPRTAEYLVNDTAHTITGSYRREDSTVRLTVTTKEYDPKQKPLRFLPLTDGIIKNGEPTSVEQSSNTYTLIYPAGTVKENKELSGIMVIGYNNNQIAYPLTITPDDSAPAGATEALAASGGTSSDLSLLTVLGLALLGGIILNVMPCVLPVLSLKILALTKKRELSRGEVIKHGVAYTAGVIACFLAVAGILIALKLSGEAIGWGFQLQSPEFVIGMAVLMLLVALNLLGTFELPVLFGTAGGSLAHKDTPLGSFLTGALTALVATPCTAPFMAPAIGFALTQPPVQALVIFSVLGFGLALPFLLVCLFPPLLRLMPKPGAWMQTFKEFLAFPMFATLAWLLWVLTLQAGELALFYTLGILILVGFLTWLLKRQDSILKTILAVSSFLAIFWLLLMLPTKIPPHAGEEVYSATKLENYRAEGSPVFVNATAAWCITCKVNEISTLSTDEVQNYLKEHGIKYLVADWTNRDEEISKLLASFDRQGVPLYIYYPPNSAQPKLLPQLLTPSIVLDGLKPTAKLQCSTNKLEC